MWNAEAETRYLGCMKVQPRQLAKVLHTLLQNRVLVPQSLEVEQYRIRARRCIGNGIAFAPGLGEKCVSSFELVHVATSAPCYT